MSEVVKADFRKKIVSLDELVAAVGRRPRQKTAIMCHGMFDIVHPGHLRHLLYAKEKADLLIASVTADSHNQKANIRPYVPQDLRALNLAVLEMVDYVIVDPHATPIEHILRIQPDYFAKGYEYFANGIPPSTQEEINALESYGGEVVFTPGDVVYSSSALIDLQAPNLGVEKLLALMQSEGVTFDDLRKTLDAMTALKVLVVGDTILDGYSYCSLLGANAKSPTFSVKHDRTDLFVGGAAVVAKHMQATGASVSLATVLGNDALKDFALKDLTEAGVACLPVIDPTRPTTHKERFVAGGYKLLQVDRVDNRPVSNRILKAMVDACRQVVADVTVFSDFRHGIFNRQTVDVLRQGIPAGSLSVADSQVASRWGNILDFAGFDLITPNEREARFALGDQDSVVRPLASELFRRAGCKYLILKLGDRGVIVCRTAGPMPREFFTVDSFVENLVDPIGSGDALLAYGSLALRASGSIIVASILGSIGAAISCEHSGNSPVRRQQIEDKIDRLERSSRFQ